MDFHEISFCSDFLLLSGIKRQMDGGNESSCLRLFHVIIRDDSVHESESPNHMFMLLLSLFPSYFTQLPGAGTDLPLASTCYSSRNHSYYDYGSASHFFPEKKGFRPEVDVTLPAPSAPKRKAQSYPGLSSCLHSHSSSRRRDQNNILNTAIVFRNTRWNDKFANK